MVQNKDLSAQEQEATKHALRRALATPAAWAAIGSVVLMSWVHQAYNDLSPTYLSAAPPLGIGLPNGSALLGFAQLAFFLGAFAAGLATERLFRGRARPGLMIGFGMGSIFALGMLLPAATESSGLMLVVLCVAAFFFSWVNPTALAYIAKTYPTNIVGKLGGYAMGIGVFGGTAGVAAGSAALHATDDYTLSIIIMSVVCASGVIAAFFLKQPRTAAASESASAVSTTAEP